MEPSQGIYYEGEYDVLWHMERRASHYYQLATVGAAAAVGRLEPEDLDSVSYSRFQSLCLICLQTEVDQSLLHTLESLLFRKQLLPKGDDLWVLGEVRQTSCVRISGAEAKFLE